MQDILVVGSLNADLVVSVSRFPIPGETISGGDLSTISGGKGANQAVAAAKLGASVSMLGRVGDDQLGKMIMDNLSSCGVDTSCVQISPTATGTAVIIVNQDGQNSIVLSPGANGRMSQSDVRQFESRIDGTRFVLLQLEIPLETVLFAAQAARQAGAQVILNPAPARSLPAELLACIDFIVPNESELSLLTGIEVLDLPTAEAAARKLLLKGIFSVVITMGEKGALFVSTGETFHVPAFPVKVVDTTAAGDAFIAGFAASLVHDKSLRDSVRYACACGALSVTKFGAQPSLPAAGDVERFLLS